MFTSYLLNLCTQCLKLSLCTTNISAYCWTQALDSLGKQLIRLQRIQNHDQVPSHIEGCKTFDVLVEWNAKHNKPSNFNYVGKEKVRKRSSCWYKWQKIGTEINPTYPHRWGTIRTVQNFAITSFSTNIIHCTVFFRMPIPDQKIKHNNSPKTPPKKMMKYVKLA